MSALSNFCVVQIDDHPRVFLDQLLDVPAKLVVFCFERCFLSNDLLQSFDLLLEDFRILLERLLDLFDGR